MFMGNIQSYLVNKIHYINVQRTNKKQLKGEAVDSLFEIKATKRFQTTNLKPLLIEKFQRNRIIWDV